ncbi:MAG: glycoside hydrolase family 9 protein [Opitutaceae bacterium]|nr:glycoside hydrolase family 9 protein [Opitutaceae bacterium]
MRYYICALLAFLFSLASTPRLQAVENTWDYSVQVSSAVQISPATITLTWPQDTNGTPQSYTIFRKSPGSASWDPGTTLPGSATSYTDTSVAVGSAYEYRIVKVASNYTGSGFIQTGINAPLVDTRGKIVLIVDNTFTSTLAAELTRLEQDLAGDGWTVLRHDVSRTDSVKSVKALIRSDYDADPVNVKSVFLFGHVPVPYSGQLNPDGHPDHVGAWPADAYYGDMDGSWTDSSVNYTQTLNTDPVDAARMSNLPGDGKFDQTTLPSAVELAVGRVDLANMPGRVSWGGPATFPSETELLRKYLNKDHAFRHRTTNPARRAVMGDYFGSHGGEAFAASGFRSFAPLVGAANIRNLNVEFNDQKGVWIPQVAQNDYLLTYGCGAGSYATMGGLGATGLYSDGSTTEMVSNNVRGVFNLLFGSWLGDWDHEDNFLRSPLATDHGLVSAWSGRPHWFLHPMGQGETVGYAARLAQNNSGHYETQINSSANRIHIALMGDPTLRLHPVVPAGNFAGNTSGTSTGLSWSASTDANIVGYHVYRRSSATGAFTRLTSSPITATNYSDSNATSGATYMVRAVKLENTPSGSYYNASQGVFYTVGSTDSTAPTTTTTEPIASTNPATSPTPTTTTPTTTTTPSTPITTTSSTTTTDTSATTPTSTAGDTVWFDDALPDGAGASSNGDTWNWVGGSPTPYSGGKAHRSDPKTGLHEHSFNWAAPLTINSGETLFTHVYLDPENPPSEIMLSWASANWEHRAYWGSNDIGYGTDGTPGRVYMGPLPEAGKWVRLQVPASKVGLEGASVVGMGFSLFNGAATWDYSGKAMLTAPALTMLPTVTVASTDAYAVIGSATDTAQVTFTRTGSTATDLVVNYTLGGSAVKWTDYRRAEGDMPVTVTIPAGSASATMTLVGIANVTNANPETAVFTLSADAAYAAGAQNSVTVTLGTTPTTAPAPTTSPGSTTTTTTDSGTTTTSPATASGDTVWFDDALPAGAGGGASGGDAWTWTPTDPSPVSGTVAHQTNIKKGTHEHYFNWASERLNVAAGDKLFVYVYLDPANVPAEIMVSWCSDIWEHRAYWGADQINYGKRNTAGRYHAGALPATGQWVRLEVPASAVGLEGASVQGMSFSIYDGRVTWDKTGKSSGTTTPSSGTTTPGSGPTTSADFVWVDDTLPQGAGPGSSGGDSWNWVSAGPAPASGSSAHQSSLSAGLHEHFFNWASGTMSVSAGEVLFTYVYIDPANPTSEIMLSWNDGSWEHRAYWGADKINYGTPGTAGRYFAGALPAAGQWVRLEVPASAVGLEGRAVEGMCFSTFDGRVTYDKVGKGSPSSSGSTTTTPTTTTGANEVTVAATDATAVIGSSSDTALVTFTRTGSTSAALLVKFALGGTAVKWTDYRRTEGDMPVEVTIPAGASSANMTILGIANTTNANPETAIFTLSPDGAYSIGSANSATLTIASSGSSTSGGSTAPSGGTTSGGTPTTTTPTTPTTPTTTTPTTTTPTVNAVAENAAIRLPQVGDTQLTILSPTVIELRRTTAKQPDPATVTDWNFVDSSGVFTAPATSEFNVTVNGQAVSVKSTGFRRRAGYAPLDVRDLRVDNSLFLELNATVSDGATVEVKNPSGALWPSSMPFKSTADALRYGPAIHVNQEGYVPSFAKKAMIGYYLGSLGEMDINAALGFKVVAASTGVTVLTGTLNVRRETGYVYAPLPYQKVLEADFSNLTTPGEYQLVVPGLGASLPFLVNDGVAMAFTRTYALGLYHQRCGVANTMPFTRHIHDACHTLPAEVPSPQSSYAFTWATIASKNDDAKSDPRHTAPQLKDEASQLYPFVNKGTIDVALGHHDAGDYSKYTLNVAQLAHLLTFTADSVNGADALDNLGIPESGDGISDILQEAKHEADYLAKLQDGDGGFYFIVYPKNREYESNVTPDKGDQQVVWPKNTSATAASVAALAQIASSPQFKQKYPADAAAYLSKAKLGWQFLTNAIARHGKDGSYQKVTFYGQNYLHDDELAWAAAELFAATGEAQYHQKLMEWFPEPSDTNTFRWGWWRMSESWGNAIRSYAFAARSGRLAASQLNAAYLTKCEEQIKLAGDDALKWSNQSAYGTALPEATRHVMGAGWYFSLDQASDMAIAYQLNPKTEYVTALVGNMNYEAGTNPVNVTYLTGLGLKRQREVVAQYAKNDRRTLAPAGIPLGNVQEGPHSLWFYPGAELRNLSYPTDQKGGSQMYPFYDRWMDTWNVTTEFITVNQARGLISSAMLATLTPAKSTAWKPATTLSIVVPSGVAPVGAPLTLSISSGIDLTGARILWEARDQQPDYGSTYTIAPKNAGPQWVEVEVTWPDGRRLVGSSAFEANSALITWMDDDVPTGASTSAVNDAWNWVTSSPAPSSGTRAHQSAAGTGLREHWFNYAYSPLPVGAGDTMFAWVYLDPANMPEEIMLHWNDGTWDHRAYWGADKIQYGTANTVSRRSMGALPAGGGWVKLEVPASAVGLEGRSVTGMCFSTYGGGKVTWDAAGRTSPLK